jgi:hypothetical protein
VVVWHFLSRAKGPFCRGTAEKNNDKYKCDSH